MEFYSYIFLISKMFTRMSKKDELLKNRPRDHEIIFLKSTIKLEINMHVKISLI